MVFGVIYRYTVWLRRPPTAMLNRRGWDAFREGKFRNLIALPVLVGTHLLAQGFIRRRSRTRSLAHQLILWGCILAALVALREAVPGVVEGPGREPGLGQGRADVVVPAAVLGVAVGDHDDRPRVADVPHAVGEAVITETSLAAIDGRCSHGIG